MFILAFLGSSLFAIAGTALLSPAQVLWIHMAVVAPIGVGHGHGHRHARHHGPQAAARSTSRSSSAR